MLKLKLIYLNILKNKFRLFLVSISLIISTAFLFLVLAGQETYFFNAFKDYQVYKGEEIVSVFGFHDKKIEEELLDDKTILFQNKYRIPINIDETIVNLFIYSVSNNKVMNEFVPSPNFSFDSVLLESKITYGTNFSEDGNANDIIISDYLARMIFNRENAVGESFEIKNFDSKYNRELDIYENILIGKQKLNVVGVINTGYKYIENDFVDHIFVSKDFKINHGESYINSSGLNNNIRDIYIRDQKDYVYALDIIYRNGKEQFYEVNDYITLTNEIKLQLSTEIAIIDTMTILISVFIFINISTVSLFSIKERFYEIGVLKSIGAKNKNIFSMILSETFIISAISVIIGCFIGYFTLKVFIIFDSFETFYDNSIVVSSNSLVKIIISPIFISLISAIIPSIYATKINIANAINKN